MSWLKSSKTDKALEAQQVQDALGGKTLPAQDYRISMVTPLGRAMHLQAKSARETWRHVSYAYCPDDIAGDIKRDQERQHNVQDVVIDLDKSVLGELVTLLSSGRATHATISMNVQEQAQQVEGALSGITTPRGLPRYKIVTGRDGRFTPCYKPRFWLWRELPREATRGSALSAIRNDVIRRMGKHVEYVETLDILKDIKYGGRLA